MIYQRDIEMIWDTGEIREIYQRHSTSEGYGSDFKLFSSDFGVMLSKFLGKSWDDFRMIWSDFRNCFGILEKLG